jgi:glycosyltransferase involved in cell wall biosynthesis
MPLYACYAQDNIISVPYGLDPAILTTYRAGFVQRADRFTIVLPGAIAWGKGQDLLLRAVATLPEELRQHIEVYCVGQVGDWDYYRELGEQFAMLAGQIHLVGEVTNERANAYIQAADVCVFPYRDEDVPLLLVQALFYGKPIIATDSASMLSMLEHGTHAMLVRIGNDADMQHHITDLYHNLPLREALGANARARFDESGTIERCGQKFIQVIEHVLKDSPLTDLLVTL